jgi:hypothetical protein
MAEGACCQGRDWIGGFRSYTLAWGLPAIALVATAFAPPSIRAWVWLISLVWMGTACLVNAHRCGRTHCHFTGPFFLLMAPAALLHGFELLPLGRYGWTWLGATIAVGAALLWFATEALWGRYLQYQSRWS